MRPDPKALPELVQDLHRQGRPWLPAGLGSRLDWGPSLSTPVEVVSCAGLNRIVDHEPGDFTITVEAGAPLVEVQQSLAAHGQWLSLDLPWGSGCSGSVGGLVARGLAGGYRQRYLGVRDQLIGLRLLRADGVAAHAGGKVVKNVAGYDLMRLFTGSWGSLGLITELTLRTMPLPPHRRGLIVQGPIPRLNDLARWLLASTLMPERIDWWSASLAAAAGLPREPLLLLALASVDPDTLQQQIHDIRGRTDLPTRDLDRAELGVLLSIARCGSDAGWGSNAEVPSPRWLLRLGVTPSRAAEVLTASELTGIPVEVAAESGLGMAWSTDEPAGTPSACLSSQAVMTLRQRCRQLGGYLTVLRQPVGAEVMAWEDVAARPLIERIKDQFDPRGLLAPGRLPGVGKPQGLASPFS
jgi:glycolate oxidase FAD binding subunit